MAEFKLTFGAPFFPFFVVITIAPFEALTPYSAVAAAPFKTLKLSISSGFRSPALLEKANCSELFGEFDPALGLTSPEKVSLFNAIPSTIISG